MRIRLLGTNHRTAPVELREKLAVPFEGLPNAVEELSRLPGVREVVLLSTCNRVELVWVDDGACVEDLVGLLGSWAAMPPGAIEPHLHKLADDEAVQHIFRVTSSLDSMVLGESQINGQVKDAYRVAADTGTVGPLLHRLFHKTFAVAKRVRSETNLGASTVSVANAAVDLAAQVFDRIEKQPILLLGAGEMGELALKGFKSRGARDIWVSNRTLERAVELAGPLNAAVLPWNRRVEFLETADVVLCSTGARNPVLTKADVASMRRKRRGRPLFLIDISVPRNLDPAIASLDSVYLFDIDDLGRAVSEGKAAREEAAGAAEKLVADEVHTFSKILSQVHVAPLLKALNLRARKQASDEVDRSVHKLMQAGLGDEAALRSALEALANSVTRKLLHHPLQQIKAMGREGELDRIGDAAKLFGIETTLLSVRELDEPAPPRARTGSDES